MVAYLSPPSRSHTEPSLMALFNEVIQETTHLIEEHIALFKSQAKDESLKVLQITTFILVGLIFSIAFIISLGLGSILLLTYAGLPLLASVGIITGVFLLLTLTMLGLGFFEFKKHYQDRLEQTPLSKTVTLPPPSLI